MPIGGGYIPAPDLGEIDDNADAVGPPSQGARASAAFGNFDFTRNLGHVLGNPRMPSFNGYSDPSLAMERGDAGAVANAPGPAFDDTIDADTANQRYGGHGVRFNGPVSDYDAAWQASQSREKAWRASVFADTRPTPLTDFGLGLAGALTDPAGLAVMGLTGGWGEAGIEGLGFLGFQGLKLIGRDALDLGAVGRLANLARTPIEGAIGNVPYVAASGITANAAGDDYSFADALTDIAAGAVLHTGAKLAFHVTGMAARAGQGDLNNRSDPAMPEAPGETSAVDELVPPSGIPDAVETLPEPARVGAFVKALDDATDDRPVDVGRFIDREQNPAALERLNEADAAPTIPSFRPLEALAEEGPAVTTRGTEVPVQYGLAEIGDLTTSHDDNMAVNGAYPPELQPRDRERAGAQARNLQLQSELNPKLLMTDTSAAAGAPIVAPDGVVESGNGRTIALRRSAAAATAGRPGGEAYGRYRAELEARFPEAKDMQNPVLVRARTEPMQGSARAALAREMNADVTERLSAPEQAMSDAAAIDPAMLSHLDGSPLGRRNFTRAFIARVAGDQANSMADQHGGLTKAGTDRIDAALVAKAYGDPRLVEALFEDPDSPVKAIGNALRIAAPEWAAMRADIATGKVPAAFDLTDALRSAIDLVRHAREGRLGVPTFLKERLAQREMFAGTEISPETEGVLRVLFRPAKDGGEDFARPASAKYVGEVLDDYARKARDYTPGPDMFGETANASTSRDLLALTAKKFADGDDGQPELLRPAGQPDGGGAPKGDEPGGGAGGEALPPVLGDLRRDAGPGGGELQPEGGGVAEGAGGRDHAAGDDGRGIDDGKGDTARALVQSAETAEARVGELRTEYEELARHAGRPAIRDTRGEGVRYHGASEALDGPAVGYYNPWNIYGGWETFYTTDAADIARGYARKAGRVYEVKETRPLSVFDMEHARPAADWEEVIGANHSDFAGEALEVAVEEAGGGNVNLRQIMDAMRDISREHGYSIDDVQEHFTDIIERLKEIGHDAMDHVGGLQTKRPAHSVRIYFKPHEDVRIREVDPPRESVPPELAEQLRAKGAELEAAQTQALDARERATAAEGEAAKAAAVPKPRPGDAAIAADPELKSLQADTDRVAALHGLEAEAPPPAQDPNTLADALHAAAVCLEEEL